MSQASEIMNAGRNADSVMTTAESLTDKIEQDWEHEATLYTFDDDSVLVVSGPQVNAFDSMTEAREALES